MGNAFVLIVVGLVIMYAVISDKFFCLEGCWNCLRAPSGTSGASAGAGADLSRSVGSGVRGAAVSPFANLF